MIILILIIIIKIRKDLFNKMLINIECINMKKDKFCENKT